MKSKVNPLTILIQKMEQNKNIRYAVYIGVAVCALVFFFISVGTTKKTNPSGKEENLHADNVTFSEENEYFSHAKLEKRLEDLLSKMEGVGKVKVMVMLDGSSELSIASDESKSKGDGVSSSSKQAVIISNSSVEEPIVLRHLMPKILGVLVIAEGADNVNIRLDIIAACSTVLGVKQNLVEVFNMNNSGSNE